MASPVAEERLRDAEREWIERGHGGLAVLDQASGRFLGRVGPKDWHQFEATENRLGALPRRVGERVGGRGCPRLSRLGFSALPVPYLTGMINRNNSASIRVARRLTSRLLRNDMLLGSEVVVYGLHRDDWSPSIPLG